jgi:hypothetical protein
MYVLQSVTTMNSENTGTSSFAHNEVIVLELNFISHKDVRNTHILVAINNRNGQRIFSSDLSLDNYTIEIDKVNTAYLTIPKETLTPGDYSFFIAIHSPNIIGYDVIDHVCPISIYDNGSEFVQYENKWFYGDVFVKCDWKFIIKN